MSKLASVFYAYLHVGPLMFLITLLICFAPKDVWRLLTLSKYSAAIFCVLGSTSPGARGQVKLSPHGL